MELALAASEVELFRHLLVLLVILWRVWLVRQEKRALGLAVLGLKLLFTRCIMSDVAAAYLDVLLRQDERLLGHLAKVVLAA